MRSVIAYCLLLSNMLLYALFSKSLQNRFLYSKRVCKFEEMYITCNIRLMNLNIDIRQVEHDVSVSQANTQ